MLADVIAQLRAEREFMDRVTHWEVVAARHGEYADIPAEVDERIRSALRQRGINRIYSHQLTAWNYVRSGKSVVLVSPTASGKTLAYNLPVLQALLEDRFKLKIHTETKQAAVYALTVAKHGPKLHPAKEGSCVPFDPALTPPYPQFCGQPKRGDPGLHLIGATVEDLCKILSAPEISDRPVIDRTGLSGRFDIQLPRIGELCGADGAADTPFDGMRAALEGLGLNLAPAKGPSKFLVIDHVERPSEN